MATFTIISSEGSEQNPTVITVGTDEWYLFIRNSSLVVKCITGTNTDTVIDTNVYSYRVVSCTSTQNNDIIVFYDKISAGATRPLYKSAVQLTVATTTILDNYLVDPNTTGYDAVSVAAYYRLSYVVGTNIIINDYTDDLASPSQYAFTYTWSLDESMNYMYHIINQADIHQITIYYVYNDGDTHIAEDSYVIMSNIITITPSVGNSVAVFTADLSNVSLTYAHLAVTPPSGSTISNIVVMESNKSVSFKLDSATAGEKTMTFSDSIDSFTANLTFSLAGPPKVRSRLGVITKPVVPGGINDVSSDIGYGRAPGVAIAM